MTPDAAILTWADAAVVGDWAGLGAAADWSDEGESPGDRGKRLRDAAEAASPAAALAALGRRWCPACRPHGYPLACRVCDDRRHVALNGPNYAAALWEGLAGPDWATFAYSLFMAVAVTARPSGDLSVVPLGPVERYECEPASESGRTVHRFRSAAAACPGDGLTVTHLYLLDSGGGILVGRQENFGVWQARSRWTFAYSLAGSMGWSWAGHQSF